GAAAAGPDAVRRAAANVAHGGHEVVAERVRIEHVRRTGRERELATLGYRIDGDDLRRTHDARALNHREAERTATHDGDVAAGMDAHEIHRRREPRARRVGEHRELRRRQVGEDGAAVLLGDGHGLGEPAEAGHRHDARAVRPRGDRMNVDAGELLAVIGAPLQTLVALPALRRARDDDAIAGLHALDHGADFLDDAHAGVIHDRRRRVVARAERERRDRIAAAGRFGADEDFARLDRAERQGLDADAGAGTNEGLEFTADVRA